ncbi:uncharacterized protein GBIM_05332 [Gryllus bimaculatus]|nr:uncharacterized protein GBIM_05332 [Gryllus bimaculatus]
MKEQLVEMTGLSPRVIRVWFQNKRCKDKKKAMLMKQQMQQEKMHGYDLHGPPPPPHELGPPPPADMAHPDSTDSYVTYLESDDSLHHDGGSP